MISLHENMLVAENCDEYSPKTYIVTSSMSSTAQNCSYCVNYENGKCTKKLFEEIEERIRIN